jgi:hypothetical protein
MKKKINFAIEQIWIYVHFINSFVIKLKLELI